jgi:hypothetical protein
MVKAPLPLQQPTTNKEPIFVATQRRLRRFSLVHHSTMTRPKAASMQPNVLPCFLIQILLAVGSNYKLTPFINRAGLLVHF